MDDKGHESPVLRSLPTTSHRNSFVSGLLTTRTPLPFLSPRPRLPSFTQKLFRNRVTEVKSRCVYVCTDQGCLYFHTFFFRLLFSAVHSFSLLVCLSVCVSFTLPRSFLLCSSRSCDRTQVSVYKRVFITARGSCEIEKEVTKKKTRRRSSFSRFFSFFCVFFLCSCVCSVVVK